METASSSPNTVKRAAHGILNNSNINLRFNPWIQLDYPPPAINPSFFRPFLLSPSLRDIQVTQQPRYRPVTPLVSSHHARTERVSNVYLENSRHETRERREIISTRREIREMDTDRWFAAGEKSLLPEFLPRIAQPKYVVVVDIGGRERHDEEAAVVKDSLDRERKSSAVIGITESSGLFLGGGARVNGTRGAVENFPTWRRSGATLFRPDAINFIIHHPPPLPSLASRHFAFSDRAIKLKSSIL